MKELLFPLWQIDEQEYQAVCSYLSISPNQQCYEKLTHYLARAPFLFTRPEGFSLYLAKPKLTRFRIARLDLASKLFYPKAPVRHILNAVIALHECSSEGYSQMSATPSGWGLLPKLIGWLVTFISSFFITLVWLCGHFIIYLSGISVRLPGNLAGKRILITGVNRGLGKDLLLFALQQGAEVIGTVRNRENVNKLKTQLPKEAPVALIAADLSKPGALIDALKEDRITADSIDIAILCAGMKHSDASVLNPSKLRETFEVNYFSCVDLAHWMYLPNRNATFVLISSIGRWHGMHSSCGYNASKAALSIWGESLEMELHLLENPSFEVMIVEPGIFESGMVEKKGLSKLLSVSRQDLATRILSGALSGKKAVRFPFWFALLTWAVCLGGRKLRIRLFARVKES